MFLHIRSLTFKQSMMKICKGMSRNKSDSFKIKDVPDMRTFLNKQQHVGNDEQNLSDGNMINPFELKSKEDYGLKFYIDTYGCQMNENDSEIIKTILERNTYELTNDKESADVVLINTCAIRESAEDKVWNHIQHMKGMKRRNPEMIFGILGCMAERMKDKIIDKSNGIVDLIVGPDAYRDLPNLIRVLKAKDETKHAINVQLSLEETYADIIPVRKSSDNIKAFVSIMRGCNNMCSFCIVPFTRGRERSRDNISIMEEVKILRDNGIKEICLLGQNVNSYLDEDIREHISTNSTHLNTEGFSELFKSRNKSGMRFTELLDRLSHEAPDVRFRFTSPHPKDFPMDLITLIKERPNICKQIHLPAQSGNTEVLKRMRRFYTREAYVDLIKRIRSEIPNVALSTDMIVGFCGETEEEFEDSVSLLELVQYDMSYLFAYSMREKTHAYHKLKDDVDEEIKKRRLNKLIDVFRKHQLIKNNLEMNTYHLVLVEGLEKKNKTKFIGRTDTNKICIFDKVFLDDKQLTKGSPLYSTIEIQKGDYVVVKITTPTNNVLYADPICKVNKLKDFNDLFNTNKNINLI